MKPDAKPQGTSPGEMPFLDHLRELRGRVWWSFVGILIGTIISFLWANWLFAALTAPIRTYFTNVQLIGTGPADAFITKIMVAFFSGAILSAPNTFYQIWKFILPGLHEHERKLALPFVAASSAFFLIGVSFCFFVVFPFAFQFFSEEFISIGLSPQIRISEYLSFVVQLILIFGIMFELPVLAFLLGRLGVIKHSQIRQHFRVAVVAIFVIAAVVTPPDVITQLLLAVPLCGLYWSCIYVCRYAEGMREAGVEGRE
jgi:sec-independent protein translocase protein TatC